MEKSGKFRLTSLERNWILYDVGNSAFVLMVATLIPIFFNALAAAGGLSSVEYLASAPVKTTVQNIRAFEDGDKVFLQTIYNFAGAGEQVAFDIFRFDENGKIAEHWDVMETIADQSTWQNQNGKF